MSLNVPEYSAAERTFQLVSQVAGRAGRGSIPGRVIIQTFMPEHYSIVHARDHDYLKFYKEEIALRKRLGYPPFSRMINILLSGPRKGDVERAAGNVAGFAKNSAAGDKDVNILGPAQCPKARIRSRYRYQILLKGRLKRLHEVCAEIDRNSSMLIQGNIKMDIDVDPVNFM